MKRVAVVILIAVLATVLASCNLVRGPTTVLYYADSFNGTDYMSQALSAAGDTVTTATSWSDFDTKLAAGSYDLAVAFGQGSCANPDVTTLTNYVSGGGRLIFADYCGNPAYDSLLDVTYTGNENETNMTLVSPFDQGVTNPMTLVNPGWTVFSMGLAAGTGGTSDCTFASNSDSCLVVGNGGRTVTLGFLSDAAPSADGVGLFTNILNYVGP